MWGSTVQTPTKQQIEWWCRTTADIAVIANKLCVDNRELRRLIALYWPELPKKGNFEALRKLVRRKLSCTIHLSLPEGPTEQGESGEPVFVPDILNSDSDGLKFDMGMSNVKCQ